MSSLLADAQFITAVHEPDSTPFFRRDVHLDRNHGPVVSATLALSALGVCEAWIDGRAVSQDLLTPGWTSYEWRHHFVEHDVTAWLAEEFTIGIAVGNGWWRGRLGWMETQRYGAELAAWARLCVLFADGHTQIVGTDESWTVGPSDILENDFYDGQIIDARRRDDRWKKPGSSDERWGAVAPAKHRPDSFTLDPTAPVRRIAEHVPQRIWTGPSGSILVDFGVNIVGFVRLSVQGTRGARVTVRHSEVLEDGELALRTLRSAASTDEYVLSGNDDSFEPTFTFHGFRFAEIVGWPTDPGDLRTAARAVAISTDLERTGTFECSVPDLNQLHANVIRGMQGNFVDVPTDCPQRDERLGWTGDIAAFAPTAAYLFDVRTFLADWLRDLALEQRHHDGVVPFTVPDVLKHATDPEEAPGTGEAAAFWSDAAVWVPWALWEAYGDLGVLEEQYESMTSHGRRLGSLLSSEGLWDTGFQFGDWLDPDAPAEHPENGKADRRVVATLCAFRTFRRLAAAARLLGRDAGEFESLGDRVRQGFHQNYCQGTRITSDCTTVYAMAIAFEILDEGGRIGAGIRLAELVERSGFRISTGFAGTPFVLDALSSTGHVETAYRLLLQRECPSWLYPVTMGATTVWERWDSMLPDGRINPGEMTSFNHYALGAVADWLHRAVGGLAPLEPGYRRILVAPRLGNGIDWARTGLRTPHGPAQVRWERRGDQVDLAVTVPDGTSATVVWPGRPDQECGPGQHRLTLSVSTVPSRRRPPAAEPSSARRALLARE